MSFMQIYFVIAHLKWRRSHFGKLHITNSQHNYTLVVFGLIKSFSLVLIGIFTYYGVYLFFYVMLMYAGIIIRIIAVLLMFFQGIPFCVLRYLVTLYNTMLISVN